MDRSNAPRSVRPGAVTLLDIAKRSGFSRSTVSLVMRGDTVVADATRERVLEASAALGYVYNRAASNLRSARTGSVGLLVTTVSNPFFAEFIAGVEAELAATDQVMFVAQHSEDPVAQERVLRRFLENRVDGIMLVAAEGTTLDTVARVEAMGTRVVLATRRVADGATSYIGSDNVHGAAAATEHLLTMHKPASLAFVGSGPGGSSHWERTAGMFAAVDAAGFPRDRVQVVTTPVTTRDSAYVAARDFLARSRRGRTAIVAYNDVVAFGVASAIRDSGMAVGHDVALVGFDDIEGSAFEHTPLTTVASMPADMGRRAGRMLLDLIDATSSPVEVVMPNRLMIRQSCGCPR